MSNIAKADRIIRDCRAGKRLSGEDSRSIVEALELSIKRAEALDEANKIAADLLIAVMDKATVGRSSGEDPGEVLDSIVDLMGRGSDKVLSALTRIKQ